MASTRPVLIPVREVAFRTRPQVVKRKLAPLAQIRHNSNEQKVSHVPAGTKGPNEDQLPHVSEEQAEIDKSMGETPPDINQGTPVQDVLKRDTAAQKNAPQVMKDQINKQQKRSYSTQMRKRPGGTPDKRPSGQILAKTLHPLDNLRRRYDPVVDQVTKSLMRHGKLSIAQKNMAEILSILRTAPPPQPNPQFPQRTLLASERGLEQKSTYPPTSHSTPTQIGSAFFKDPQLTQALAAAYNQPVEKLIQKFPNLAVSPAKSLLEPSQFNHLVPQAHRARTGQTTWHTTIPRATLPLHPIEYLTTIIDSVAPMIKIRQQRGIMGGGASLPIPVPLGIRQRRRQAIQWILAASEGRREVHLYERFAKELLRVAEGTSPVWERRAMVHRLAVSARSNVRLGAMARRKR